MSGLFTVNLYDCSDFVAGDASRSSNRWHGLDETALFGSSCWHEVPLKFINLKHGERLPLMNFCQ